MSSIHKALLVRTNLMNRFMNILRNLAARSNWEQQRAARLSTLQGSGHYDLRDARPAIAALFDGHLRQFPADGAGVDAHAGEARTAKRSILVVESHQAHIAGNIESVAFQRLPGAVGYIVAGAKKRGHADLRFNEVLYRAQSFGKKIVRELGGEGVGLEPGRPHRLHISVVAFREPGKTGVRNEPDFGVPELLQVRRGLDRAAGLVEPHLVERRTRLVADQIVAEQHVLDLELVERLQEAVVIRSRDNHAVGDAVRLEDSGQRQSFGRGRSGVIEVRE